MRRILSLVVMLAIMLSALAQTRQIKGIVVDEDSGPSRFVTTDIDGQFFVDAPDNTVYLEISYIGFKPQRVRVPAEQSEVTVTLGMLQNLLDEVVVVGYGTQKKVNLTGAVGALSVKEIADRPSQSLTHMLQGAVPGLNITTSSGLPGSSPTINVRGVSSVNATSPLILVDGVEGNLDYINPADVKNISVIKDASAAAIYGARAAFGVILVTTKSGSETKGKATVRYSGRFGWEATTTSTDYEDRGYWSVYTANTFQQAYNGTN